MLSRKRFLAMTMVGLAAAAVPVVATADGSYPERTIKFVIPFPPGGPTDVFGRLFAASLAEVLGQPVVPHNVAGAGSAIGVSSVANATADGYTVLFGTGSIATGAAFTKLPYDPRKDIEPVALAGIVPLVLLAAPDMPNNVSGLVAALKAAPGKHGYGSAGPGTTTHLAGEMFKAKAGLDIVHVPYRGSGPALLDTAAGRQAFLFETITASKPMYTAGKLQLLAVGTKNRSRLLPDVPTVAEGGVPGMAAYTWNMVFVPPGTPKSIIDRLNKASNQVLSNPDFAKKMAGFATEVVADSTPATAKAFLHEELDTWAAVVKAAGVKAE
jgi:tripartite-type tricarboxylate transporter receptor subunit TctC